MPPPTVSVLVSVITVCHCPHRRGEASRSLLRTLGYDLKRKFADLESGLGSRPRGFESRILRPCDVAIHTGRLEPSFRLRAGGVDTSGVGWPATRTPDWSRCRPATPSGRRSGVPMGVELARRRPGLCSIDCVYGLGQFYNLGPRRSDLDGLRGQRLDRPRLIMQQGALLLQVPSTREATVPHRELPGLSFG
jgi:hypothetical protein